MFVEVGQQQFDSTVRILILQRKILHYLNTTPLQTYHTTWMVSYLTVRLFTWRKVFKKGPSKIFRTQWRRSYHIETNPLICYANQWTGLYMIGTTVMNKLKNRVWFILEQYIDSPFTHRCHPTLSKERLKFFESTWTNIPIYSYSFQFFAMYVYLSGVINVSFLENFANVPNKWFPT